MSFYAGKYNGKTQCHITKGSHNIIAMRGAPFSNTVFHTDVDYMDYIVFPLSAYSKVSSRLRNVHGQDNGFSPVSCYQLSGSVVDYIRANYSFSIYDHNNTRIYHSPEFFTIPFKNLGDAPPVDSCLWTNNPYKDITAEVVRCATISLPKRTYKTGYEWIVLEPAHTYSIIIWGLKTTGALSPIYSQNRSGDIRINKTTFKVGSYDVLNMKYLSPNIFNTVDTKLLNEGTNNDFQLIGNVAKGSSIEITSNNTVTEIKKGGHIVISSNAGSTMIDSTGSESAYISSVYSGNQGRCANWTHNQNLFSKSFAIGEVIFVLTKANNEVDTIAPCIDSSATMAGDAYSSCFAFKYNEGFIATYTKYKSRNTLITRKEEFYGVNGKLQIKSNMIIDCSYASGSTAGMTTFGGTITVNSLK